MDSSSTSEAVLEAIGEGEGFARLNRKLKDMRFV